MKLTQTILTALAMLGAATAFAVAAPALHSSEHQRARAAVEQVLAEPEFADLNPDAGPPWWVEWLKPVFEAIRDFFAGLPDWLFWVVIVWMILTLVAIALHLVWVLIGTLGGGGATPPERRPHAGQMLGIADLEFDSVYDRAQQLLQAGDWAAAVRYLYVATLLWLDRSGRVRFRPSKTNRDYLSELRTDPPVCEPFVDLTRLFEHAVYRGDAVDQGACHRMHQLLQRIRNVDATATR